MKVRRFLVSNSSSSSFILFLDKVPRSVEEVGEMLGMDLDGHLWYYTTAVSVRRIAERVLDDLRTTEEATLEDVTERLYEDALAGDGIDMPKHIAAIRKRLEEAESKARITEDWEHLHEVRREYTEALAAHLLEKYAGKHVYILEYSDNCMDYEAAMEHGDIFRSVPHVYVNHH